MKMHTAGKGDSFPSSLTLSTWDADGAGSVPHAPLPAPWWGSTGPPLCDPSLCMCSWVSAKGTAAFQCPPEGAQFALMLSTGTTVGACGSIQKGDYLACQQVNYSE